jgi:hypothetical protein
MSLPIRILAILSIFLADVVTACRYLELFGTFFPFTEKSPAGEKSVKREAWIFHLYGVGVPQLEGTLS